MTKIFIGAIALLVGLFVLSGCSKMTEPYKDAPIQERNTGPAHVGTMPDGFSNWGAKCDGPNMVYVLFKGDNAYGSIHVVPNDPRCSGDNG